MDLALFDFDGTISDREMFIPYLEQAVPRRRLMLGKVLLAPLAIGYKLGWIRANLVRAAAIRFGLSGLPLTHLQASGVTFAEQVLPATIRPEALERLRWHQARGDTVVVVSGALEVALTGARSTASSCWPHAWKSATASPPAAMPGHSARAKRRCGAPANAST